MRITRDCRVRALGAIGAVCLLWVSVTALGQAKKLTVAEAKDHIGEEATLCGRVASTRFAATTKGKPTFLNLDKPYLSDLFTVLI